MLSDVDCTLSRQVVQITETGRSEPANGHSKMSRGSAIVVINVV